MAIRQKHELGENTDDLVVMTREDLLQVIDAEARACFNLTGQQFIKQWHDKQIPDTAGSLDIGILVNLLDQDTVSSA
jgi:hypothetical protein